MATSLPAALRLGPVHLVANPRGSSSELSPRLTHQNDRSVLALDLSVDGLFAPNRSVDFAAFWQQSGVGRPFCRGNARLSLAHDRNAPLAPPPTEEILITSAG
jgi:hypothetical protein